MTRVHDPAHEPAAIPSPMLGEEPGCQRHDSGAYL